MLTDQQRQRIVRYGAQRERFLVARASTLQIADAGRPGETRTAGMPWLVFVVLTLVPLVVALLAAVFDIAALLAGARSFSQTAGYLLLAACVTGVVTLAAVAVVWVALPPRDSARRVGAWFAAATLAVTLVTAIGWATRRGDLGEPSMRSLSLALTGATLAVLTGWLAGELFARLDRTIFVVTWDDPPASDPIVQTPDEEFVPAASQAAQAARA